MGGIGLKGSDKSWDRIGGESLRMGVGGVGPKGMEKRRLDEVLGVEVPRGGIAMEYGGSGRVGRVGGIGQERGCSAQAGTLDKR